MRRRAFTAVELLVALAIGASLLLMAAMAFRAASQAISRASALARQNDLLRLGVWHGLQDADYWHTAADPRPPYLKGWTRLPRPSSASSVIRPFAPVRFLADPDALPTSARTVANPSAFLPHRLQSWSRVHVWANQHAFKMDAGDDTTLFNYDGMLPPGWCWRTLHGDYGLVEATTLVSSVRFPDYSTRPHWGARVPTDRANSLRPVLQRQLLQHLGPLGMAEYGHAGNAFAFHDERGCFDDTRGWPRYDGASPDAERHWNLLHTRSAGQGNAMDFSTNYVNQGASDWAAMLQVRFEHEADVGFMGGLALRMPVSEAMATEVATDTPFAGLMISHGDEGQYEGDLSRTMRDASLTARVPGEVSDRQRDYRWLQSLFPSTSEWDWRGDGLADRDPGQPGMVTESTRYLLFQGSTLSTHRVEVVDTGSDERIDLRFTVIGTTYRGARQHWALIHRRHGGTATTSVSIDGWPSAPVGDFYE